MPSTKRGTGFSAAETDNLLELMATILPIGGEEWDRVEREHSILWPAEKRTVPSLKRKFQSLYQTKVATGDPNCPPQVRRAKHIQNCLKEKTNMSDGDDDEDDDDDDDDNSGSEGDGVGPGVAAPPGVAVAPGVAAQPGVASIVATSSSTASVRFVLIERIGRKWAHAPKACATKPFFRGRKHFAPKMEQ